MRVAVCGKGKNCAPETSRLAHHVGKQVGGLGHELWTGGLGGVMAAAASGAREVGGRVVAVLPALREGMTPHTADVTIDTALPEPFRNVVLASSVDAMLVLLGSHGTLQELAVALDREIPIASVDCLAWASLGVVLLRPEEVAGWLKRLS